MNKARREALAQIATELEALLSRAESCKDEEQYYFDAMPESFQGGSKGEAAEEAINHMDDAVNGIQQAIDAVLEIN